ncbi:hypothetical protein HDV03_004565 [Kappamyces sp. JEL0829]|nr:hypothetical protein HDV03_004565 [Kappamyces sp. JEL0829]
MTTAAKYSFAYIGSVPLFDRTIQMPLPKGRELPAGKHRYPFQIALPPNSPPSMKNERMIVEYLMVGMIAYENGCCGAIPILQRSPVSCKRQVVVKTTGFHESYYDRIQDAGYALSQGVLYCFPGPDLLIKLNPVQHPASPAWTVQLQARSDIVLKQLDYSVWQHGVYTYRLHQQEKKQVTKQEENIDCIVRASLGPEELAAAAGELIQRDGDLERLHRLVLPMDWDQQAIQLCPDVHTKVGDITHALHLDLVFLEDGEEALESLRIPIQVADDPESDEHATAAEPQMTLDSRQDSQETLTFRHRHSNQSQSLDSLADA